MSFLSVLSPVWLVDYIFVQEAYFRYMAENPNAGVVQEEEDDIDYDSDGNPIPPQKKAIDPLPSIDHTEVSKNLKRFQVV